MARSAVSNFQRSLPIIISIKFDAFCTVAHIPSRRDQRDCVLGILFVSEVKDRNSGDRRPRFYVCYRTDSTRSFA